MYVAHKSAPSAMQFKGLLTVIQVVVVEVSHSNKYYYNCNSAFQSLSCSF